jgi:dTDP-glucose 4,6-dehydratase
MQDPEKYVPMVIRNVIDGDTVTIHGTEDQIGSRFYLHARNQADALVTLLKGGAGLSYSLSSALGQTAPDRYNVVGEVELNNLELAQMVADILEKPLNYQLVDFHSTRPGHDLRYALDGARIKQDFDWEPPVKFRDSLAQTVEWLRRNR